MFQAMYHCLVADKIVCLEDNCLEDIIDTIRGEFIYLLLLLSITFMSNSAQIYYFIAYQLLELATIVPQ